MSSKGEGSLPKIPDVDKVSSDIVEHTRRDAGVGSSSSAPSQAFPRSSTDDRAQADALQETFDTWLKDAGVSPQESQEISFGEFRNYVHTKERLPFSVKEFKEFQDQENVEQARQALAEAPQATASSSQGESDSRELARRRLEQVGRHVAAPSTFPTVPPPPDSPRIPGSTLLDESSVATARRASGGEPTRRQYTLQAENFVLGKMEGISLSASGRAAFMRQVQRVHNTWNEFFSGNRPPDARTINHWQMQEREQQNAGEERNPQGEGPSEPRSLLPNPVTQNTPSLNPRAPQEQGQASIRANESDQTIIVQSPAAPRLSPQEMAMQRPEVPAGGNTGEEPLQQPARSGHPFRRGTNGEIGFMEPTEAWRARTGAASSRAGQVEQPSPSRSGIETPRRSSGRGGRSG
jgi:hypothetical protein